MPNTRWYDGECNFCGWFEFISYVCKYVIFIQFNLFDINTFHVENTFSYLPSNSAP